MLAQAFHDKFYGKIHNIHYCVNIDRPLFEVKCPYIQLTEKLSTDLHCILVC